MLLELGTMPTPMSALPLRYVPPLFFAASFVLYALHGAVFGFARTERFDKLHVSPLLPRVFLEYGYFLYRAPVRACVALGITANMLTIASVLLCGVGAFFVAHGRFTLGGWTLLLAFTCDGMDGVVARATDTVSKQGEFIDSVADHYSDLLAYLGFAYLGFAYLGFAYYYRDRLPLLLLVVATMLGSSVVSYSHSKGAAMGVDTNVGYMRRFEHTVWLGGGTVLAPIVASFVEPQAARPTLHVLVFVFAVLAMLTHATIWVRARAVFAGLREHGTP